MGRDSLHIPHSSSHGSESDHALLHRFENGEEDAATAIHLRYAKRIKLLAKAQMGAWLSARVEPDDIVQSVFCTFFQQAAEGRYQIPEGEELWKLLLVITLNEIRALGLYHSAAKRDVKKTIGLVKVKRSVQSDNPTEAAYNLLRLTVNDLLDELPEDRRAIVALRIDGHVVKQIAEDTKKSKRSVERILQDFRKQLRASLEEE